eukprot:PLAT8250.1.p2 GENE.PLAT8250.1~~PLAT8250.1.p2  ORF type:complete len:328 (+),score=157.91 PLAT8250.1:42-986(+)
MAVEGEPASTSAFWFSEAMLPELVVKMGLKRIMFEGKSAFQKVQVVETAPFGKTLVLDGKTQSALFDEYVYHESLVHPAMLSFGGEGGPKTVYIGGGGELATAREVLRHKSVEKCVMVDIDEVVVDICRAELPEWNAGVCDDERLELHYDDANAWLRAYDGTFDVIIMDIADPIEAGPGIVLYTQEFYEFAITKLNPGGVLVTQSGPCAILNYDECFTAINRTLASAFKNVVPYHSDVPSFGCPWGFNLAYNHDHDAAGMDEGLDERLAELVDGEMRHYDSVGHRGMFGLPKAIRKGIEEEKRIITVENPVFMY